MKTISRVTYIGHSTILIEMDGLRLLTDPVFRQQVTFLKRTWPEPSPSLYRNIDAVFISHLHYDHLDFPSLRLLEGSFEIIVPRGAGPVMQMNGFREFREISKGETHQIGPISITAIYADHDRSRLIFGPYVDPLGYMIDGSLKVYFPGDTRFFPEFASLRGGIDLALMPVWGWGPNHGTKHMNPKEAAQALNLLEPGMSIPIHWGTYLPWGLHWGQWRFHTQPPLEFARHAKLFAPQVDVRILKPGESIQPE